MIGIYLFETLCRRDIKSLFMLYTRFFIDIMCGKIANEATKKRQKDEGVNNYMPMCGLYTTCTDV